MNVRKRLPVLLLLVTGLFWLLLDAKDVRAAVWEGLSLCGKTVIPSLFPFLVVSSLLMTLGFGEYLSGPLSGLMRLYHIGGAGASALILGLIGGYPVGARTAADLYRDRLLSRDEAERLLTFCNNTNPAFLIDALGVGIFGSVRAGIWLWLIHLLSALLTGLVLGERASASVTREVVRRPPSRTARLSVALLEAVRSALSSILSICAFVIFFCTVVLPLKRIGGTTGTVLVGLTELFSAVSRLTPDRTGFILAAALSGWGGVSVQCQTLAVLADSDLNAGRCIAGKAVQGLLSLLLALGLAPYVLG